MPLSFNENLIFIHIPKTGGTTVQKVLGLEHFYNERPKKFPSPQHYTYSDLRNLLGDSIDDWFSFSFVRNPYSRIFSEWKWRKTLTDRTMRVDIGFEAFVYYIREEYLRNEEAGDNHWRPQSDFIDPNINFIGRFENFEKDFSKILERIYIYPDIGRKRKIPNLNRTTSGGDYRDAYYSYTKKEVENLYQKDLDTFGYTF